MNTTEFASAQRAKSNGKIKAAITERWNERIVSNGWDKLGKAGAAAYLERYGKGISAAKATELALCAEAQNAPEVAEGFWEAALAA